MISTRSHTLPSVVVQKGLSSSSNSSIHHGTAEYNEHQHRNHRQIPLNTARPSEGFINRNNQQHPVPSVANHSTYQHGVHGPVASTTASQSLTSSKRTGRATAVSLTQRRWILAQSLTSNHQLWLLINKLMFLKSQMWSEFNFFSLLVIQVHCLLNKYFVDVAHSTLIQKICILFSFSIRYITVYVYLLVPIYFQLLFRGVNCCKNIN